ALLGASITYRIATGPREGQKVFTLQTLPAEPEAPRREVAESSGFSLHAGIAAKASQRDKLERLARYVARPPVATERLSLTEGGNVRCALKTPYRDGTTHVIFEPEDFIARLAALVLDGLERAPRTLLPDQFGLVEADNRLRECVVVGGADAPDGRLYAGFGESLGVTNRDVLHAAIAVVNERLTGAKIAVVQRLLERIQCDIATQRARHSPTDDRAGVRIDHEGDVPRASPRRDVAQSRHPQSVRPRHSEGPIDTVQSAILQLVGDRGSDAFTAYNAAQAEVAHESFGRTTRHLDAFAIELLPHFVGAVNAIVLVPHALHFRLQRLVAFRPFRTTRSEE